MSKLTSRRFWITIWSIVILTFSLFLRYEPSWMFLIAGIPVAYIAADTYSKKQYETQKIKSEKT